MKRARAAPPPTAAQRTVSLFTGKTDLEDPRARDGTAPDPEDHHHMTTRPKVKWKGNQGLTRYDADSISAMITVERQGKKSDGPWLYRVFRCGLPTGEFRTICEAADAAERPIRATNAMASPTSTNPTKEK